MKVNQNLGRKAGMRAGTGRVLVIMGPLVIVAILVAAWIAGGPRPQHEVEVPVSESQTR